MRSGSAKIACRYQSPSIVAVILVIIIGRGMAWPVAADPTEPVLELTPDKEHYYVGPYLVYMEDPFKALTIDEASSPQMSLRFVRHSGKMLNLGLNSSAYWIRFTIDAFKDQISQKKWLLYFDWPNRIDYATLYIPKFPDGGWFAKEVGRILPTGRDPQPSTPTAFLPPEAFIQPVTFYLRVESSEAKIIPLQILTDEAYQGVSRARSLWFGVYYGIMLAMFLYNLILLISLRELNRFYYLMYLLFIGLLFLESNGLLWEFLQIGIHLGQVLILIFISLTFFWSNLFTKSFLITKQNAPFFDKLLPAVWGNIWKHTEKCQSFIHCAQRQKCKCEQEKTRRPEPTSPTDKSSEHKYRRNQYRLKTDCHRHPRKVPKRNHDRQNKGQNHSTGQ